MNELQSPPQENHSVDKATSVHRWVLGTLHLIMAAGFLLAIYERQWFNALLVLAIIFITVTPSLIERRFKLDFPAEFEIAAVVFVFAALFLGEIRGYYERYWWWDIALHTTSGFLLGILGFLLVYILNESERIDLHMRPRFVALFAFVFAVAMGAIWEIFEFAMDQIFGTNMQKPMLGDPSGLTDTMWDLIVDAIGAFVVSVIGWWYMHRKDRTSFIEKWIRKFIERNPRLFGR